jgi:hypothetical protein
LRSERGRGLAEGICIGLLFPLDANRIGQTEKVFEDPSMPREISSRSLPPLGRFARIKKKEREKTRLGTLWPNFKFEFESLKRDSKIEQG